MILINVINFYFKLVILKHNVRLSPNRWMAGSVSAFRCHDYTHSIMSRATNQLNFGLCCKSQPTSLFHSISGRKARALYACKAEHDSELSFIAGTIFENGESLFRAARIAGVRLYNLIQHHISVGLHFLSLQVTQGENIAYLCWNSGAWWLE